MDRIDLVSLSIGATILVVTIIVAVVWNRIFKRYISKPNSPVAKDIANYTFLRHTTTAIIYVVGFSLAVYSVPSLRVMATTALAGAGILAVAVGFASQHALSNVISGLFIILFKPYRVGDRLKLREDLAGVVEDITLRHTVIRDYQNQRIVIPNTIISDEVIINLDLEDQRNSRWLEMDISYDSDIDKAREIMTDEILNHPLHIDGRTKEEIKRGDPEVKLKVVSLGDFSVKLRAWVWTRDTEDGFTMHWDLTESIKKRFDREGVEIPFPYRTIVYKKDIEADKED